MASFAAYFRLYAGFLKLLMPTIKAHLSLIRVSELPDGALCLVGMALEPSGLAAGVGAAANKQMQKLANATIFR